MAAIVPSDPYSIFIRKVGYSVGLENTFSRVADLVKLYVEENQITTQSWQALAHSVDGWNLRNDHIADFFRSINLIRRQKGEIQALPCLDSLALAYVELDNEQSFDIALKIILGSHLVLADGDIFLNFLAGEFDRNSVEPLLREMIVAKRAKVIGALRAPQLIPQIVRTITIDVQATNVGSANAGKGLAGTVRREPLKPRTEPLSQGIDPTKVEISDDYFRKVTGRRKDWARSLELVDESGHHNEKGQRFLRAFADLGLIVATRAYAYWPFAYELERAALSPASLSIPRIDLWAHLNAIRVGLCFDGAGSADESSCLDEVLSLTGRMYDVYQRLSPRRHMLRKEVPVSVLLHAGMACYAARNLAMPPISKIVVDVGTDPTSKWVYRKSKNFEGTVSVRS